MTSPKVSIVVPYYNRWDLTHAVLYDLYRYAPEYCEIILINDSSTELDCESGVVWWQNLSSMTNPFRYKKTKENLGFGGAMNFGSRYAKGEIVVFLSNDVRIYGNCFDKLVSILEKNPTALVGGQVVDWKAGWNEFDINGNHIVIPYANGWFLSTSIATWDESGGFDPRYGKFDYEDVDISTWFYLKGYDIISLDSHLLKHEHQGSTISSLNIDRLAHTQQNREIYIEKWSSKLKNLSILGE